MWLYIAKVSFFVKSFFPLWKLCFQEYNTLPVKKIKTDGRQYNRPQPRGLKLSTTLKYMLHVFLKDCFITWLQTYPITFVYYM